LNFLQGKSGRPARKIKKLAYYFGGRPISLIFHANNCNKLFGQAKQMLDLGTICA